MPADNVHCKSLALSIMILLAVLPEWRLLLSLGEGSLVLLLPQAEGPGGLPPVSDPLLATVWVGAVHPVHCSLFGALSQEPTWAPHRGSWVLEQLSGGLTSASSQMSLLP